MGYHFVEYAPFIGVDKYNGFRLVTFLGRLVVAFGLVMVNEKALNMAKLDRSDVGRRMGSLIRVNHTKANSKFVNIPIIHETGYPSSVCANTAHEFLRFAYIPKFFNLITLHLIDSVNTVCSSFRTVLSFVPGIKSCPVNPETFHSVVSITEGCGVCQP